MSVLVTGGAGFIGSHTVVELIEAGYKATIVDNFSNSSPKMIDRLKNLVKNPENIDFVELELLDSESLDRFLSSRHFDSVVHFAALKAVGESVSKPLEYYRNNLVGLLNLLDACVRYNIKKIIFSSSATVYGDGTAPYSEEARVGEGITNPYGQTKLMSEIILRDFQKANPSFKIISLRYFNPVGAHSSGTIGEDPQGIPNNLVPYIQRVAIGRLPELTIHGADYPTEDGTALRDYIHVVDLANGHVCALKYLDSLSDGVYNVVNLGTGTPSSVLDVVKAYSDACGHPIKYVIGPRRAGDVCSTYAVANLARELFGWTAKKNLKDMCEDSWRWVTQNPNGLE